MTVSLSSCTRRIRGRWGALGTRLLVSAPGHGLTSLGQPAYGGLAVALMPSCLLSFLRGARESSLALPLPTLWSERCGAENQASCWRPSDSGQGTPTSDPLQSPALYSFSILSSPCALKQSPAAVHTRIVIIALERALMKVRAEHEEPRPFARSPSSSFICHQENRDRSVLSAHSAEAIVVSEEGG